MVVIDEKRFHNVCPLYTYHKKDGFCYSDPVNKARLMIFPVWNQTASSLDYLMTFEHSSLISPQVLRELKTMWMSSDKALLSLMNKSPSY